MLRKTIISLVATAALGAGMITMIDDAEAHRRHHNGGINIGFGFVPFLGGGYGYGYPGYGYRHYGYHNYGYRYPSYYDGYDDYVDCRYRRVAVKKWNKAHTRKIIVYKKKRICY